MLLFAVGWLIATSSSGYEANPLVDVVLRTCLHTLALNSSDSLESKLARQEWVTPSSTPHQVRFRHIARRAMSYPSQLRPAAGVRIKFLQKCQVRL